MDKSKSIIQIKQKKYGKLNKSLRYRFNDGTVKCIFADGEEESVFPDGTIQRIDRNGIKTIETPDGRKRVIRP